MDNEQTGAGLDGRTRPAETKLSGANEDRKIFISTVQLTTSRIGSLNRLIHTLPCTSIQGLPRHVYCMRRPSLVELTVDKNSALVPQV